MPHASRIIEPTSEPITRAQAKDHSYIEITDDDTLVDGFLASARDGAERYLQRSIVAQTWKYTLDRFPGATCPIELPWGKVLGVSSIVYVDTAGATQTLAASAFTVDLDRFIPIIVPSNSNTWPNTDTVPSAVTVEYTAGYVTPVTYANGTNLLTSSGHTYADDDRIFLSNQGGGLPAELSATVRYFVTGATGNDFNVALTSGGAAVAFTDDGTGNNFAGIGSIPPNIINGIKLMCGDAYENREISVTGTIVSPNKTTATSLFDPYRIVSA